MYHKHYKGTINYYNTVLYNLLLVNEKVIGLIATIAGGWDGIVVGK